MVLPEKINVAAIKCLICCLGFIVRFGTDEFVGWRPGWMLLVDFE